ncbi:DNA replication/repair protein RecF [Plantibacter sp. YIM 135347]|uniref:DNA replication/repair protein RecF n=1 Tax=Plantibacter sp. YIM 135347 TaxID=3423919 RepID=UPI003D33191A
MIVRHVNLTDYRNYAAVDVALEPGPNLFVGRNGQGKTNLVEAIGYLSTLGSHRVSSDQALIRHGADAAIIRIRIAHHERELLAEVQLNRGSANRAQVNRSQIKPRELPRYVSTVLFAPEDLLIVRGDPSARRRFIDQLLVQRTPRLAGVMSDYERSLKQRNSLLKSARSRGLKDGPLATLDVWDERLVQYGSEIIAERVRLVKKLAEPLRGAYAAVAGDDHGPVLIPVLSITGSDAEDDTAAGDDDASPAAAADLADIAVVAERFREALAAKRPAELDRGLTLVGPHRDDVFFGLNGLPVKGYASHGESWSFALAAKLASAELLRADSSLGDPVLILDDVFAELDTRRRARLAAAVSVYDQVIITAAVFDDVPEEFRAHVVHIEAGRIIEAGDDVEPAPAAEGVVSDDEDGERDE